MTNPNSKVVVIGGTGLIGSKVVKNLRDSGIDAVAASPDTGVNTITGEGLAEALKGASVVVDVSNSPSFEDAKVLSFFETSTSNLLAAEEAQGVRHHVALSVVGTDRMPDSGYMRAKIAQEKLIRESSIPYSIVHATQFFEFLKGIADGGTDGDTVRLAPVLIQPTAAEDVAAEVTKVAVGEPLNGITEIAGPQQFRLTDIVAWYLEERNDPRVVAADPDARYYGTLLQERTLVPDSNATIGKTKFEDWLIRQGVSAPAPSGPVDTQTTRRATMTAPLKGPNTIVLIHGFWVTARSWENWIKRYEALGYRVLAPAYPGFEVEVEALNRDPSPVERLTVPAIMTRLETVVGGLESPPILIGHSAGGAFTQLLLDRGYGAVGVAIDSAPTEGVRVTPLAQLKASFPVLKNPANRHRAVALTYDEWRYIFTNTFDEADARAAYERYHVPASGGIFWDSVLANFIPGPQEVAVNYHNDARPPLLFISGGEDHLMPPAVQRSNAKHYKGNTITEIKEFEGRSHLMPAQKGWEEVADYALTWAVAHATVMPEATATPKERIPVIPTTTESNPISPTL